MPDAQPGGGGEDSRRDGSEDGLDHRNVLGFDEPWHRDWLFWIVFLTSAVGGVLGFAQGKAWWTSISAVCGGVLLGGVLLGSLREFVRGLAG